MRVPIIRLKTKTAVHRGSSAPARWVILCYAQNDRRTSLRLNRSSAAISGLRPGERTPSARLRAAYECPREIFWHSPPRAYHRAQPASHAAFKIASAAFPAIMMTPELVLPDTAVGMMEASPQLRLHEHSLGFKIPSELRVMHMALTAGRDMNSRIDILPPAANSRTRPLLSAVNRLPGTQPVEPAP